MKIKNAEITIMETAFIAKVYNDATDNIEDYSGYIKSTFKTQDGLEKGVREHLKQHNLSLVKIVSAEKHKCTYSMPIDMFMNFAECVNAEVVE